MYKSQPGHLTFSEKLWVILDKIGFTEEFRRWCLEAVDTREMLCTVETGFGTPSTITVRHEAGSSVDGTFRFDLNSDIDWLLVISSHSVGDDLDSNVDYLMVSDYNTLPGYVRLKANQRIIGEQENAYYESFVDERGDTYLTNTPQHTHLFNLQQYVNEKSGPALTTSSDLSGIDNVYGFQSKKWPHVAKEWFKRPRHHNWPSEDTREVLRKFGCFVVPTGHPSSKGKERYKLEWRLSFTLQERHLMVNLNEVQYKCYVLLKIIKEDIVTPFVGKSLSSYHCKTSLFYTTEENDQGIWRRDNLTECVCKCLGQLLEWSERRRCPNYFLPQSNLFLGKIDNDQLPKLVEILRKVLCCFDEYIEKTKCERLGEWIQYFNEDNCDLNKEQKLLESAKKGLAMAVSAQVNCVAYLVIQIVRECFLFSLAGGVIDGHFHSLQLLHSQYRQINSSLRDSMIPAIAYLHSSLASHLASLSLHAPKDENDWFACASVIHFIQAIELDPNISRLKLANVLQMAGYKQSAKAVLEEMGQTIKVVELFGGLEPRWLLRERFNQNVLLHSEIDRVIRMPVSKVLKRFTCAPMIFLPTEMDMTPHALRFEMFRSIATPYWDNQVASLLYRFYYDWAVVEAEIFYHFLCYQTGLYSNNAEFLQNGYDMRLHNHHETWWNIVGWVSKDSKCFLSAATAFLQSWLVYTWQKERSGRLHVVDNNQSLHNASKLHMLLLIYDIWKNDYSLENAARAWSFMSTASTNPELLEFLNRLYIPDLYER